MASGRASIDSGTAIATGDASACDLLAQALARCAAESCAPLLQRHAAPALRIQVLWPDAAAAAAQVRLSPAPDDSGLRSRIERAILRCPVARRLAQAPAIDWQD